MEKKPVHLIMVTADNHNKYYNMIPKGDVIEVEYGRVDKTRTVIEKPMRDWDKIYREKINKGYVDKSELIQDLVVKVNDKKTDYKPIPNKIVADIVSRLQEYAENVVKANYKINANQVTQAMIDEAQTEIDKLGDCKTVKTFNNYLLKLFTTIPRSMNKVQDYLANDIEDFAEIVKKEQDLLDVMRGQVFVATLTAATDEKQEYENDCTILEALGIVIEETNEDDVRMIKKELGDCANKYFASWKVTNIKNDERFKAYVKETGLKPKDIKMLWHGTRNENVWSILKTGLVLRPNNAIITGKMFGYGLYNAPKARKSLGYTSLEGSYWASGSSKSGFMILHECAYGKPYDVYSFDSKFYNFDYNKLQKACPGANCLHAHAGKMLRNDEIIVYKEDQMNMKYLVELKRN